MNPLDPNQHIEYDVEALQKGSQVVLVRHAKSLFNEAQAALKSIPNFTEKDEMALNTSEDMRD